MKKVLLPLILFSLAASSACAAVTAIQTVDLGGQRSSSSHYTADQSLGRVVGISEAAAPLETIRHGYIGQLTEVSGFNVLTETNAIDEGASQTLSGLATLDDDTVTAVEGSEVSWEVVVFPLLSVSTSGLATATNVYEDTLAAVTGRYQTLESATNFLVINVNDDDFGTYAGDGLPDDWQVGYFGIDSAEAGPTNNVDLDTLSNEGEWTADTDPTDSNSYFQVSYIVSVAPDARIAFESSSVRQYSLEVTTNQAVTGWAPVTGQTHQPGNDGELMLTDTNPAVGQYFYRVTVAVP